MAALLAMLALAGCGDDEKPASRSAPATTASTASSQAATSASTSSAPSGRTETQERRKTESQAPANSSSSPESLPGGAGDEIPIRVPAAFVLYRGRLKPPTVTIPAFLAVELVISSLDKKPYRVRFEGPQPTTFSLKPTGRASKHFDGFRRGTYTLQVLEGGATAKLIVGGEPGP